MPLIIAVDGPAASGKGTIAARLAPMNEVTTLTGIDVVPMHADLLADVCVGQLSHSDSSSSGSGST